MIVYVRGMMHMVLYTFQGLRTDFYAIWTKYRIEESVDLFAHSTFLDWMNQPIEIIYIQEAAIPQVLL